MSASACTRSVFGYAYLSPLPFLAGNVFTAFVCLFLAEGLKNYGRIFIKFGEYVWTVNEKRVDEILEMILNILRIFCRIYRQPSCRQM